MTSSRVPDRAGGTPPAEIRDAIKSGGFERGLLHLVLDRAQPGRHRRRAARPDGRRLHRPADRGDGPRVRAALGRGARGRGGRHAGRRAGGVRGGQAGVQGRDAAAEEDPAEHPPRPGPRGGRVPGRPAAPAPSSPRRCAGSCRDVRPGARRPDPADVRQGGHRRAGADPVHAGRRAAHRRLAGEGRVRGGVDRGRRSDPVRCAGGEGRPRFGGRRPVPGSSRSRCGGWRPRSGRTPC